MSAKHSKKSTSLMDFATFLVASFATCLLVAFTTNQPVALQTLASALNADEFRSSYNLAMRGAISDVCLRASANVILELAKPEPEPEPALEGPALYNSYVDAIVELYYPDLDPNYVKAIIYHESRYDPTVTNSSSGVRGLMQISPKWHTKRAQSLGVTDLYDPYGNILVGCDLLNDVTQNYDFNYALNFFAGGYTYANRYKNSISPYVKSLNSIIESGVILW